MKREVQPEWLDVLPADNPAAVRSRRDLRRVNTWMRSHAIMAGALHCAANGSCPKRIVDLGAGDGDFLLRVARRLACSWKNVSATLLDRQPIVAPQTFVAFAQLGWHAEPLTADVFDWGRNATASPVEVVVTNLLLHHFTTPRVAGLFRSISNSARLLVAVEPRRGRWPLFCSRALWAIACNAVTQHDAAASVRAGFTGRELSALWPANDCWHLVERPAGLFNHLFIARREHRIP